jgi:aminopeptidase N
MEILASDWVSVRSWLAFSLISASLLIAHSACSDSSVPIDSPVGPISATVSKYDYAIDLVTRKASVTVQAIVDAGGAGDCWSLPFRGSELTELTFNGEVVGGDVNAGKVTICGVGVADGSALTIGAKLTVPAKTLADSQVGFSQRNDGAGKPFTYLVSWVGGCDQFGPCDNRPDQFAAYRFVVSHPSDTKVRCAGVVTQDSATQTTCNFDYAGGPSYSTFGIVASPSWTVTERGMWGPLAVTVYDRPSTGINANIDSNYQTGFINWMISQFGAFPFGNELRILTGPTYWSGFEHPGNIVLSDGLARAVSSAYANPVAHVLTHEIAHQWAGDQTTLKDTYDFVWKESMAEYLSFVYEAEVKPGDAAITAKAWKTFSGRAAYYPVPAEKPPLFDYYGDVYGPGPMILFRQVEALTSRAQVVAALKMLLGEPRALSVDEVIAALQTTTGMDLGAYVAAWVKGTGAPVWPRFVATYEPGAPGAPGTLGIVQSNVAQARGKTCKFHVALKGPATTAMTKIAVDTFRDGPTQTLSVPALDYEVATIEIDVDSECLAFAATMPVTTQRAPFHPWAAQ